MVICALADLSVIVCFTQTSLSPVARSVNPATKLGVPTSIPGAVAMCAYLLVKLRSVNTNPFPK
jgi:hypothetical protein